MTLLRIRGSMDDVPPLFQWALVNDGDEPVIGEGPLAELPRRAARVQLVLPAAQVLIVCASVPRAARRRAGSLLAFAVEEQTAGEPDANRVSWLGTAGDRDVLAVVDHSVLRHWGEALDAAGIRGYEIHCETLLLPWTPGTWSLAWNGREGFVRKGEFEGAAIDCGDHAAPPLSLRLLLDEAAANNAAPRSIALYTTAPDAAPDITEWARVLGITVHLAGHWDWRMAPADGGIALAREHQHWRALAGLPARLRPAAWILGAALAIHAGALATDWTSLAHEQRILRQQMESRFRAVFPDAVAVVDPALQMRRKLTEARHAAGQPDSGDFLPMLDQLAPAMKNLPAGGLRILSYESGRMTMELGATDEAGVNRIITEIQKAGLTVQRSTAAKSPGGAAVVLTVRTS
jgi:general secretion pathway protein L